MASSPTALNNKSCNKTHNIVVEIKEIQILQYLQSPGKKKTHYESGPLVQVQSKVSHVLVFT